MEGAEGNANRQLIHALLRSRLFRDYESVFTKATGLPLTLRPLEYWQLAHHGTKPSFIPRYPAAIRDRERIPRLIGFDGEHFA